eukprot:1161337-Pelagomonas_calceolata.AAC.6
MVLQGHVLENVVFQDTRNVQEALYNLTSAISNVTLDPVCTFCSCSLAMTPDVKGVAKDQ